eukprot:comp12379_c0_seq1/m.7273 comp12379_c0_seq1/g.7273  ORF comp12379_c0_seq1/g.7273 comp12379_c0_seq1/m.7273 type:complete len:220 (-) comp12379_c0_seq1:516-1175(-)
MASVHFSLCSMFTLQCLLGLGVTGMAPPLNTTDSNDGLVTGAPVASLPSSTDTDYLTQLGQQPSWLVPLIAGLLSSLILLIGISVFLCCRIRKQNEEKVAQADLDLGLQFEDVMLPDVGRASLRLKEGKSRGLKFKRASMRVDDVRYAGSNMRQLDPTWPGSRHLDGDAMPPVALPFRPAPCMTATRWADVADQRPASGRNPNQFTDEDIFDDDNRTVI